MNGAAPLDDVDPADAAQVEEVLADALRLTGFDGLIDLLTQLPGVQIRPGRPGGLLRRAMEGAVWLGAEHSVSLTSPPVHRHVVGGVVLAHDALTHAALPGVLAPLCVRAVRDEGRQAEASLVLTAARNAYRRL